MWLRRWGLCSATTMGQARDLDSGYYLRLLVDRVPTMLAYWDRELRCRFANRAYEDWFGVGPGCLLGTHVRDLLGPEIFEMNRPMMLKALAGEQQRFERLIPGPGGGQRHSLAEYIPDVVAGQVCGFLVQVTNLGELKRTQAALRRETALRSEIERHALQLEDLLAQRTEMLNVLAHEVRQPLNNAVAALQGVDGALSCRGDSDASHHVSHANRVVRNVLLQIDNTLAVATLLARSSPIQRDDVDIDTLISITRCDLPDDARARVVVVRETATRTALMDMSLVRLALRNVLLNSLEFSSPGTPVTVTVSDTEEPPALQLSVADHGPGIPAALQSRLFQRGVRGVRVDQVDRGSPPDSGLGLYIVHRVMALHGGRVRVVRTGASGTVIELSIPQADEDDVRSPSTGP